MKFNHPAWLVVALAVCITFAGMWWRYDRRQTAALKRFISTNLRDQLTRSISVGKRRLTRGLLLSAWITLCAALAGPLVGYRWETINRRGNEIVFAIDTSRSMMTPDVKPDRLTRAKLAIDDFTNQLDGDAVGIVAFAGSAFLVCPITLDYGAFRESLAAVDTNTIPHGGTNIASAIHEAQSALRRRPGGDHILILITDGEDLEGSALSAAQDAARDDGLKIYTVGVGTTSGDLIPIPKDQGGGFVKDEGEFVKSRLDESGLQAIANATGGFYIPLGTQGEGLQTILNKVFGSLAKHDLASRQQKVYTERYQWPLAASLLFLLASLLIGTRRRRATRPTSPAITSPAITISCSIVVLAMLLNRGVQAQPVATTAPGLPTTPHTPSTAAAPPAAAGPLAAAASPAAARGAGSPVLEYNAGTTAYRAGQFAQAEQAFQQSINHSPSSDPKRLADQEDAYYNLGNTLYRAGQATEKSAPKDTIKKWNDAVKAYDTALQLRSNDADSKYNRDLVKRKIDALQQPQNPPQDDKQNKGQGQGQGEGKGQPPPGQQGRPPPGQQQNQSSQGEPPQGSPQQGQQPPQSQPPQGQPPQGQPPQGQAPQGQPSQGQPSQGQPPQAQPPPGSQQNANNPQQPGQPPPSGAPRGGPQPQSEDADSDSSDAARAADNEHQPGQMSREEARELLDSVKGDERHALGAPLARRDVDDEPDKPIKNW